MPQPPRSDFNAFPSRVLRWSSCGDRWQPRIGTCHHVVWKNPKRAKRVGMNEAQTQKSEKWQAHRPSQENEGGEECRVAYVEKGRVTFGSLSLVAHVYRHVLSIVRSFCYRCVVNVFRRSHGSCRMYIGVVNYTKRTLNPNPRGIPLRSSDGLLLCLRYLTRAYSFHITHLGPNVHAESVPSV